MPTLLSYFIILIALIELGISKLPGVSKPRYYETTLTTVYRGGYGNEEYNEWDDLMPLVIGLSIGLSCIAIIICCYCAYKWYWKLHGEWHDDEV